METDSQWRRKRAIAWSLRGRHCSSDFTFFVFGIIRLVASLSLPFRSSYTRCKPEHPLQGSRRDRNLETNFNRDGGLNLSPLDWQTSSTLTTRHCIHNIWNLLRRTLQRRSKSGSGLGSELDLGLMEWVAWTRTTRANGVTNCTHPIRSSRREYN